MDIVLAPVGTVLEIWPILGAPIPGGSNSLVLAPIGVGTPGNHRILAYGVARAVFRRFLAVLSPPASIGAKTREICDFAN